QGNGTLAAHVDYGVGKGTSVAIGDLNGDGRPDVAVSNGGGMANLLGGDVNSVAVFFNRGRGVLSASMDVATGVGPRAAAIGDMNGDHRPDLVAVNYTDQTVSVLVNQGGGTFAAHVDYPAGSMPWSLALGDVNGDGLPDVAVPDYGGAARVLLNRSGGALSAPLAYPVGTQPVAAAIGDLNGDAAPDLAVANSADDTVTVLLNHGGGTFAVGPSHGVGTHPNDVAIGDLDGDGNADLVVADQDFSSQSGITVLLNKGDGTFPTRMDFGSGPGPSSLALADFNGDRALDVAVVNSGGDTISVLLNKGCH
ncbi:MAG TPA: VCBS repeat-containing protein, partial [Polyangiaceae bacterium]|nr:VCBS repeat-containing protein [Polyangiaceae bacterium]